MASPQQSKSSATVANEPSQHKQCKPMAIVPLDQWVDTTRRLLARERDEEIVAVQQELETLDDLQNPNVLVNLRVVQSATGLFGRTLLKFAFPSAHVQRPKPHQFTVGDLVQIRLKKKGGGNGSNSVAGSAATKREPKSSSSSSSAGATKYPTGIVARVEETGISVALGENEDLDEEELLAHNNAVTLDRLVNNATFVKISSALDRMVKFDYGAAQSVVEVVFSGKAPSWNPLPEITPFNDGLNESQLEAIKFALASKDLALIHGPPGTGKTTTVVEFILQAVKKYKMKVLVCAPSNIAVDNVLEKLATVDKGKLQLTRIGHPARLLPQVLKYCLDAKIEAADGTEIVNDIRKEMTAMESQLRKTRDKAVRFNLRRDLKANRKEIRQREQNVVRELVKQSDVVFATNVGAASKLLKDVTFDLVVIDEAAQALEASCWIPIIKAKRCVLAGDHLQLPPTIKSKSAASDGLEVTLFDRITRLASTQSIVKMLRIQYRMHAHISDWSSRAMYNSELESFEGVARRKLHELPHVSVKEDDELLNATLLLIDTAGCGLEEDQDDDGDEKDKNPLLKLSKSNEGEARVVAKHVRALLQTGLKQEEVAIITPYNKQVQTLKALLLDAFPNLEIRSVDGFQGCEKEAVVMSLVRSNGHKQVGFLADDRRMNVAITRAKRHVAVVCDSETISAHKFLDVLVKHFETFGEYRSAQEYLEDELVHGAAADVLPAAKLAMKAAKAESKPTASKPSASPVAVAASSNANAIVKKHAASPASTQQPVRTEKPQSADSKTQAPAATVSLDNGENAEAESKEVKPEAVETKSTSVFQMMMASDSDSSSSEGDDVDESKTKADHEEELTPPANSLLKDLHLSRLARQPPPPPASSSARSKKKKGKKKKITPPAKPTAPLATAPVDTFKDGEDELEFLERQAKNSNKCSFQGGAAASRCKKTISMMGSLCKFCKLKFCYEHGLPEVHGCGDAVRQFERVQFQQQARKPQSAEKKPLSADKRKLLKKKLEEKVTEKTAGRTVKANEKK